MGTSTKEKNLLSPDTSRPSSVQFSSVHGSPKLEKECLQLGHHQELPTRLLECGPILPLPAPHSHLSQ